GDGGMVEVAEHLGLTQEPTLGLAELFGVDYHRDQFLQRSALAGEAAVLDFIDGPEGAAADQPPHGIAALQDQTARQGLPEAGSIQQRRAGRRVRRAGDTAVAAETARSGRPAAMATGIHLALRGRGGSRTTEHAGVAAPAVIVAQRRACWG